MDEEVDRLWRRVGVRMDDLAALAAEIGRRRRDLAQAEAEASPERSRLAGLLALRVTAHDAAKQALGDLVAAILDTSVIEDRL